MVELEDGPCSRGPVAAGELPDIALVAGGMENADHRVQRWVAAVSHAGCVQWVEIEGELAPTHQAIVLGIAADPEHGAYAVGHVREPADAGDGYQAHSWLRRYAVDGTTDWTRDESGERDQVASGVAIDQDGSAIVVGGSDSGRGRGWLRRYTPDGDRTDRWQLDGVDPTHVLDVVNSGTGERWVSGWTEDDSVRTSFLDGPTAFVAGLDADDAVEWFAAAPSMSSGRLARGDTTPVLVGPRSSIRRWSSDGAEQWTTSLELRQLEPKRAETAPDGTIVVGGSRRGAPVVALLDAAGRITGVAIIPGMSLGEVSDVSITDDGTLFVAGLHRHTGVGPSRCSNWIARAHLQ